MRQERLQLTLITVVVKIARCMPYRYFEDAARTSRIRYLIPLVTGPCYVVGRNQSRMNVRRELDP